MEPLTFVSQGLHSEGLSFRVICACLRAQLLQLCPTIFNPVALSVLCPCSSPGKNTEVSCRALLQGIFPTQGSSPCLLHLLRCREILYPLSHLGSPQGHIYCANWIVRMPGPVVQVQVLLWNSHSILGTWTIRTAILQYHNHVLFFTN